MPNKCFIFSVFLKNGVILTFNLVHPKTEQKVARQIYTGLSKDGRKAYFKSRKELGPVDKFNYQFCSSWDYGWDIKAFQTGFKPSVYSRSPIVKARVYNLTCGFFFVKKLEIVTKNFKRKLKIKKPKF